MVASRACGNISLRALSSCCCVEQLLPILGIAPCLSRLFCLAAIVGLSLLPNPPANYQPLLFNGLTPDNGSTPDTPPGVAKHPLPKSVALATERTHGSPRQEKDGIACKTNALPHQTQGRTSPLIAERVPVGHPVERTAIEAGSRASRSYGQVTD